MRPCLHRPLHAFLPLGAAFFLMFPIAADTASGDVTPTVIGTVTVEQTSPMEALGKWTLLMPDGSSVKFSTASYTVNLTKEGNYILFAEPPEGMTTKILAYKGSEKFQDVSRPQVSFVVASGEHYRFAISYILSRIGEVAVNSNPSGIPFRLDGPNAIHIEGTTPYSMQRTPEGQYTVWYFPGGCVTPRPQSLLLRKDGRLAFTITIDCATLVIEEEEEEEGGEIPPTIIDESLPPGERPIVVTIDGKDVAFRDVLQKNWFASYVFTAVKSGIVSGYRGWDGKPLGLYGPGNSITVGELAKIAHELAGIDESETKNPSKNRFARGAWFAQYIASAEALSWTIYADGAIDLTRPATRGEVLVTLLQVMDIPLLWPKGTAFRDVNVGTPYAAAIETAALEKIVSGDEGGTFRPLDNINRAEVAKILSILIEKYKDTKNPARESNEENE